MCVYPYLTMLGSRLIKKPLYVMYTGYGSYLLPSYAELVCDTLVAVLVEDGLSVWVGHCYLIVAWWWGLVGDK